MAVSEKPEHGKIPRRDQRYIENDAVKHCAKYQVLAGLSVCTELQLPCARAIHAGKCPLGYKA